MIGSVRRENLRGLCIALACLLGSGVAASRSSAQPAARDVAAASDAFSRAQQAELRNEWSEAATLYALADQLAPTPEALRSAARAAQKAGLTASAATHAAALLARESADPKSRALAEEILRATEVGLARVHAQCSVPCRVMLEGQLATAQVAKEHVIYARPGARRLSAAFEEGKPAPEQAALLTAGVTKEMQFAPLAEAPAIALSSDVAEPPRGGLSPWVFASSAVLTGAACGLSIWSGMAVKSAHDSYDRRAANAQSKYEEGQRLEKRTNVLLGVSGGLALVSVVTAIFTDWQGSEDKRPKQQAWGTPSIMAHRTGATLGFTRTFGGKGGFDRE
jgi:hypothetical protein